jgi:hypothetical protein
VANIILYSGTLIYCGIFTIGKPLFEVLWLRHVMLYFDMSSHPLNDSTVSTIIVAVTKLHASRPRKDFNPPPRYRAALNQQYSVASFATLLILSCLHSPGLRCSYFNVVRFCCDLETCELVTTTIAVLRNLWHFSKKKIRVYTELIFLATLIV